MITLGHKAKRLTRAKNTGNRALGYRMAYARGQHELLGECPLTGVVYDYLHSIMLYIHHYNH